jgi:hypothetical protein
MKEYKDTPEKTADTVNEPAVVYEVAQPRQSFFAPIDADDMDDDIPLDANGDPIGTPWEEVLEEMYDDLSKHYGVDLRTL